MTTHTILHVPADTSQPVTLITTNDHIEDYCYLNGYTETTGGNNVEISFKEWEKTHPRNPRAEQIVAELLPGLTPEMQEREGWRGDAVIYGRPGRGWADVPQWVVDRLTPTMLTAYALQNTNPNESGMQVSVDLSDDLRAAFNTAGADLRSVHAQPDDTIRVDLADGGRIAVGEDNGWVTATVYDVDGEPTMVYEGTSLSDLAAVVARLTK